MHDLSKVGQLMLSDRQLCWATKLCDNFVEQQSCATKLLEFVACLEWALSISVYVFTATSAGWVSCSDDWMAVMSLFGVEGCIKSCLWTSSSYIDLNCPLSQCVSLQWTIRDSCVVNVPCTLLVEGDVILLRPGQIVSVKCRRLKVFASSFFYTSPFRLTSFYLVSIIVSCTVMNDPFFDPQQLYTVSQKMTQLWNGIARNYTDRFRWYLAEMFERL